MQLPDARKVKNGSSRYILQKTLHQHYQDFKDEHPNTKLGISKFAALKPPNVKPQTKSALNACICELCANIELKLQAVHKKSISQQRPDIQEATSNRFVIRV